MRSPVRVGIIGDYNPRLRSHLATDSALRDAANNLSASIQIEWLATQLLEGSVGGILSDYDAILCSPGGPYKSMSGALNGIRFARESGRPFIGTCGGFQHVVVEYARNVLGLQDAQHAEYDPESARLVVTPFSCSLKGKKLNVRLMPGSKVFSIYGRPEVEEEYHCNYGLNPEYRNALDVAGLHTVGVDDDNEARVLELPRHRFFVATLYVPQHLSTREVPHPLLVAYLKATVEFKEARPDPLDDWSLAKT